MGELIFFEEDFYMSKKFLIGMAVLLSASLFFLGCPTEGDEETKLLPSAVDVFTVAFAAPVTDALAATAITATTQYTGTIAWTNGEGQTLAGGTAFASQTVYTATVTLAAKDGFTFEGVEANKFTHSGTGTATNPANSGVVTIVFPATGGTVDSPATVTALALTGLFDAPVTGEAAAAAITETDQYTGTIAWSYGNSETLTGEAAFAANTVYTATVTLNAKSTWHFTGVTANSFTYGELTTVTNAANTGTVTIVFPSTGAATGEKTPLEELLDALSLTQSDVEDDTVTLTADVTLPADVTLVVPADITLAVPAGRTLTIAGTLAGAVDAADANVAAKIVVETAGAVTGAGANVFYLAESTTAQTTVAAGTYIWDAAAGGADAAGWKELQVVTEAYALKEGDGADAAAAASGISIASALKNTSTNTVTLKLTGEYKAEYLYYGDGKIATAAKAGTKWDTAMWGDGTTDNNTPPAGQYGAVYVSGFFPAQATADVAIQIKPYPGIVFYTGGAFDKGEALTEPETANPCNYVAAVESDTQRWKKWNSMPANEIFGVILYSGAANKTVKLDIDSAWVSATSKTDLLNVVIDYSAVTYEEPGTAQSVTGYSLTVSEATNAEADVVSGVSITSATKNPATGAVTIVLGGTFNAAYVYTGNGQVGMESNKGASWDTDTWDTGTNCSPPAGKYGAVYIKGLFGTGTTNDAIQIKPYPALNFYTDYIENGVSPVPLTAPSPVMPMNYIGGTEGERQRWKLYASHAQDESFGVLLNSTATDKYVTLDIDQYDAATAGANKTGDILTVTIDYSAVGFGN
jgi:hypothetical protein